jgi:hypothetical protein
MGSTYIGADSPVELDIFCGSRVLAPVVEQVNSALGALKHLRTRETEQGLFETDAEALQSGIRNDSTPVRLFQRFEPGFRPSCKNASAFCKKYLGELIRRGSRL